MNPFEGWRISSPYGMRIHPIRKVPQHHAGIDLVKPHRYPIPAFVGGVVEYAGGNRKDNGFGLYVRVRDKYGYMHYYAHLDEVKCKAGQSLKRGDIIGLLGTTGQSTGPHLHYEVRRQASPGTDVDPTQYLVEYFRKEVSVELSKELEQVKKDLNDLKRKIEPAKPWQHAIMHEAERAGLIDKGKHLADDIAQKWYVVELIRKTNERIDGLEERLAKLER